MREEGQATAEWVGLVLALTVAFTGLLGAARGADFGRPAHELGEALVGRLAHPLDGRAPTSRAPAAHPPTSHPPGGGSAALRPPSLRYLARGVRPVSGPSLPARARRALRSLARAGRHAWFLCVGYRGLRNDAQHPRSPREFISPHAALDVVNECLNPLEFLLP